MWSNAVNVTRIMWYAGTMLTALVLLAVSATSAAPDQADTPPALREPLPSPR